MSGSFSWTMKEASLLNNQDESWKVYKFFFVVFFFRGSLVLNRWTWRWISTCFGCCTWNQPNKNPPKKQLTHMEPEIFTPKIMESLGVPSRWALVWPASESSGVTFLALINGSACGFLILLIGGPTSLHWNNLFLSPHLASLRISFLRTSILWKCQ